MGFKKFDFLLYLQYSFVAQWLLFNQNLTKTFYTLAAIQQNLISPNFEIKKYANVDTFCALQASLSLFLFSSSDPSPATAACSSSAVSDTWTTSFSKLIVTASWLISCTWSLFNFKSWSSICPFSMWKAEFWPVITASRPMDMKVVKMEKVHRSCIDADQSIQKQWTQNRQKERNYSMQISDCH